MLKTESRMEDALTDKNYWNRRWLKKQRKLPQSKKIKYDQYLIKFIDLFDEKNSKILELGCAPGSMIKRMSWLRPHNEYYGLDYSEKGIEICEQNLEAEGIKATLFVGDLMSFVPPHFFDIVVSFGLVEHFSDPVEILKRHKSFVRPGGYIAISVPNYGHKVSKWIAPKIDPNVFEDHNISVMNYKSLEMSMEEAGLQNVNVGGAGKPKLRTSCTDKTITRQSWRLFAKTWNIFARVLPEGIPWYKTLWAYGRVLD